MPKNKRSFDSSLAKMFALLLLSAVGEAERVVAVPWSGRTVRDLHSEYRNIFLHGNRNAASHRWATFLLARAARMEYDTLIELFGGFCAVSGSTVRPGPHNRYRLNLSHVSGGSQLGDMHYCCWPCVCDTQDFIRVDTKNVISADGIARSLSFAVIGNPCEREEMLHEPFVQPFDGRVTTLARDAAEVRCLPNGALEGATLSDSGYVIISMFFAPQGAANDEAMFAEMCATRAAGGYRSGMGEIFRKVAAIAPITRRSVA